MTKACARLKPMLFALLGTALLSGCANHSPLRIGTASDAGSPHELSAPPQGKTQETHPQNEHSAPPEHTGSIDRLMRGAGDGLEEETVRVQGTAQPSHADLPSVIRHAMRDNPDIGIALARERDERLSIDVARAKHRPTASLSAGYGLENSASAATDSYGVDRAELGLSLHQTIYDFGRTEGNIQRRKALHNSAGYRRIHKMNEIAMDVASAFLDTLEAERQIALSKRNITAHEDIMRLVRAAKRAGNGTMADEKRVKTRLEKARTNLIDLRSRHQNARDQFIRLTGLQPQKLNAAPKLGAPLPPKGITSDQYPDNPELLSVRADIDSLRAQAKTARANMKPTIGLDVTGTMKHNTGGETGLASNMKSMLSLNYKLLDGQERLNLLRQILVRITENKHRYRKKRREYVHDLENALRTIRTALKKKSLLRTRTADSAKVLDLYKAQFREGGKTVFELLDAQLELFNTTSEKIANEFSSLRSIYQVHALRGDLVPRLLK